MRLLALAASFLLCLSAQAQQIADLEALIAHSGWKTNFQPIVGYNSDTGFGFGTFADIVDYGYDPGIYPGFNHRIHLETEYCTRGLGLFFGEYESSRLIPGIHLTASFSFLDDPMARFYGFGGDITSYDRSIDMQEGIAFYNFKRNRLTASCVLDGMLTERLGWNAGIAFRRFKDGDLDRKGYDPYYTLYNLYKSYGIIDSNELEGSGMEFRAGLSWDSRNNIQAPDSGIFAEAMLIGSPDIFGTGYAWLKFAASLRAFWTPGPEWMTLACRLAFQDTIAGDSPFCFHQTLYPSGRTVWYEEGLGGMTTVRGMLPGRLVGAGYAWANLELRIRVAKWGMDGSGMSLFVYPFFDAGTITRSIKLDGLAALSGETEKELAARAGAMHCSAGLGTRYALDGANSICIEFAAPLKGNDGSFGLTTSLSHLF